MLTINRRSGSKAATSPPPPPGPLLLDHFVDPDGTLLTAHVMDVGPGWTVSGVWKIESDSAAKSAVDGTFNYATSDSGKSDVTVSATVTTANVNGGVVARYVDDSNNWSVRVTGGNTIELYEKKAGAFMLQATGPCSVGSTYVSKLVCSGTTISGFADSASVTFGAAVDFETATKCGLWQNTGNSSPAYNTFQVTSP